MSTSLPPKPEPTTAVARLKLIDVIAQSVGFMGPVFSSSIVITVLIAGASGASAGGAGPLSVALASVGVLALSWIVAQYAKRIRAAGSLYNYVSHGLGVRIGAAAGLVYYAGILMLGAAVGVLIGGTLHDTLAAEFGHPLLPTWGWQAVLLVLVAAVAYAGVQLSVKAQLTLALVSALVLLGFFVSVIVQVGVHNDVAAALSPHSSPAGMSGVLFGVVYGVLLFTGFETAANLAEETARPKRDIPRAVLISVIVAAGFFLVATYAQVAGFGFDTGKMLAAVQSGQPPLIVLGGPASTGGYGSDAMRRVLEVVVLLDMLAVYIGCTVSGSRGVFALARDRWLPAQLATTSRRLGTPLGATILAVVLYLAWIVASQIFPNGFAQPGTPPYFAYYLWVSGFGIVALLVVYLLVSVGAPRGLRDHERPALVWICAVLGAALAVGAIFGAIYQVPAPTVWAAYGPLILFALAVVVAITVGRGRSVADLHQGRDTEPSSAASPVVADVHP